MGARYKVQGTRCKVERNCHTPSPYRHTLNLILYTLNPFYTSVPFVITTKQFKTESKVKNGNTAT